MRISFDLDGVITNSEKWVFTLMEAVGQLYTAAEAQYYATRLVRYNPYLLLSKDDEGFILTARKPQAKEITMQWLLNNGIHLPVSFIDQYNTINWKHYDKASIESGQRKASEIEKLSVSVHFDNNPIAVSVMRSSLPAVRIIQVGGEPCLSYM